MSDTENEPTGQYDEPELETVPDAAGAPEAPAGEPEAPGIEAAPLSREDLEAQWETAQAEIERLQDQLLRSQAEMINFRKRVQRERAELAPMAQAELLGRLVPVIDDFERAVGAETEDVRAYHTGIELILRTLQSTLEKAGVERFEPLGEPFDPEWHEAIARAETDEAPEGQILEVYQAGYRLRERLVRPAAVVVAYGGSGGAGDRPDALSDDEEVSPEDPEPLDA